VERQNSIVIKVCLSHRDTTGYGSGGINARPLYCGSDWEGLDTKIKKNKESKSHVNTLGYSQPQGTGPSAVGDSTTCVTQNGGRSQKKHGRAKMC